MNNFIAGYFFLHAKEDRGVGVPRLSRARGDQRSRGGVTGSLVCLRFSSLLQARVSIKNSAVVFPSRHNFFLAVFTDSKLRKIQERTPKSNV